MSVAKIAARYVPPTSVYRAELKIDALGYVIGDVTKAVRAHDAEEALKLLKRSEERLTTALEAVSAAMAEIDAELAPEPMQVGDAAACAVMSGIANGVGVTRLVPRISPVKSDGAMGTVSPRGEGPEAA